MRQTHKKEEIMARRFERRHYEAVACVLAETRPGDLASGARANHDKVVEAFVKMFSSDNSNFKPIRFREKIRVESANI